MASPKSAGTYALVACMCAVCILFGIAVTIVLALIPLYLPPKSIPDTSIDANAVQRTYSISVPGTLPSGPLSDSEKSKLSKTLKSGQSATDAENGAMTVTSGDISSSGSTSNRRKRQASKILILIVIISGRSKSTVTRIGNNLDKLTQNGAPTIVNSVINIIATRQTTVTVPPNLLSTASGRRRRRDQKSQNSLPLIMYND